MQKHKTSAGVMARLRFLWSLCPAVMLIVSCHSVDTSQDRSEPLVEVELLEEDSIVDRGTLPEGWVDVEEVIPGIILDLRYATANNFVDKKLYDCPRCLLRPEVAKALKLVQDSLYILGYQLKVFDCYRPRPVQEALWKTLPDPSYVTNPAKGSMHNRGAAVDVTLLDLTEQPIDMGTPFDYFGPRAYHTFTDLSSNILAHRRLLRETMLFAGFGHIRTEWWHYSYRVGTFELSDYLWPCP